MFAALFIKAFCKIKGKKTSQVCKIGVGPVKSLIGPVHFTKNCTEMAKFEAELGQLRKIQISNPENEGYAFQELSRNNICHHR